MTDLTTLTAVVAAGGDPGPFALLHRAGGDHLDLFTGPVRPVGRLADIPLPDGGPGRGPRAGPLPADRRTRFRLRRRRHAAGVPGDHRSGAVPWPRRWRPAATIRSHLRRRLRPRRRRVRRDRRPGVARRDRPRRGANFVVKRTLRRTVHGDPWPRRWPRCAGCWSASGRVLDVPDAHRHPDLVGATPERHVSVDDGLVMMNPISGTFRHSGGGPDRDALLRFLADRKEVDELYMVLDEELKMMAAVAEHGGQVRRAVPEGDGPPRAHRVPARRPRHPRRAGGAAGDDVRADGHRQPDRERLPGHRPARAAGRGYYAGVLALLGRDAEGRQTLDAPILIRTAEITRDGELRVPSGATLVRHSTLRGEVAETHAKAAGVLAALGLRPDAADARPGAGGPPSPTTPASAPRWPPATAGWPGSGWTSAPRRRRPALARHRALIVDGEDTFTGMLAHQLPRSASPSSCALAPARPGRRPRPRGGGTRPG